MPNGLSLFISGDNLRKGAALNAVQIAELIAARNPPPNRPPIRRLYAPICGRLHNSEGELLGMRAVVTRYGSVLLMVTLALTAGCGPFRPSASDAPTGPDTIDADPKGSEDCIAPTFTVDSPPGWAVNNATEAPPCRYFHPEPFEVPQNTETVGLAIHLGYDEVPFEVSSQPSEVSQEIIDVSDSEVDGLAARRIRSRSTGEGLLDKGVQLVSWSIRAGAHRTFFATTIEAAGDFEANIEVLDTMVASLDFSVEEACSAAEMVSPASETELSEKVERSREEILAAALSCDYDRLDELSADEGFTFSYGGSTDFAAFLRQGEEEGRDPMRKLVQIMGATPRESEIRDETHQVWPAAATYESWAAIPEPAVDDVRRIYPLEDLQSFAQAEQYLGYRPLISVSGNWLYFVAGD